MRRSLFTVPLLASVAALAGVGCEDGPNQTFSPAPSGAADLWNSGNPDASVDPGKQTLDAGYPGHSLTEICSADVKRQRWGQMLDLPIVPPRLYGGVDMAGDGTWRGIKIEEVETQPHDLDLTKADDGMKDPITGKPAYTKAGNCQGNPYALGACGSGAGVCGGVYWGDNQEVQLFYQTSTHVVDQMALSLGYSGKMSFKDETGQHTYSMALGDVPRKDGQPFLIHWEDDTKVACPITGATAPIVHWHCDLTELYNAAMYTFAGNAGIPYIKSQNCKTDRGCLASKTIGDGYTYFGIRPLFVYWRSIANTPQPVDSILNNLYNFWTKQLPYSNLPQVLKLDATGPYASGHPDGAPATASCTQNVGLKFGDLLKNCVQVTGKQNLDTVAYNKIIGGRTHDMENWQFNVIGVNQNITKVQGPFDVIQDPDIPGPNDLATDWTFDVRAKGHPSNDYTAGALDWHGVRLVFIEWAREMLAAAAPLMGLATPMKLGDARCTNGNFQKGCTGLEGIMIPGNKSYGADPLNPPATLNDKDTTGLYDSATSLSPGDPNLVACTDLVNYSDCDQGVLWDTALQHVIKVLGKGDVLKLPSEMRDRRFYFKYWGQALVKYYRAYGIAYKPNDTSAGDALTPTQVMNTPMDLMSAFFDNNFGDQFDKIEYVERAYLVDNPNDPNYRPWDFEYGSDVKGGNQRYDNWYRRMDREEIALYTALLPAAPAATTKTGPPGKNNMVNLTNMFGSPVLAGAFPDYATAIDPTSGPQENGKPALDANGTQSFVNPGVQTGYYAPKPLLYWYPAVWGRTVLSKGHSAITVKSADKNPNIGAAKITIPNYLDPFHVVLPFAPEAGADGGAPTCPNGFTKNANGLCDAAQDSKGALVTLTPWVEMQPGVGFPVPVNGSRDKQVTTAQLDFTGNLETYIVDYEPWVDQVKPDCKYDGVCSAGYTCGTSGPETGKCVDGTIKIDAIEASDFVGEVFPCMAANGDILHVGMYTSAHVIVDWLANHPGAQDACDIVIRYSPFNNYIDFITSRANGVRLAINAGQGLGRVVDAILFDPTFAQQ